MGQVARHDFDHEADDEAANERRDNREPIPDGPERAPGDDELARDKGADAGTDRVDEPLEPGARLTDELGDDSKCKGPDDSNIQPPSPRAIESSTSLLLSGAMSAILIPARRRVRR